MSVKCTIITVCLNAEDCIQGAIESVLSQSYTNIEYIIVDGASNDRTIQIINNFKDKITKVISKKDLGVFDAMNKGLSCSEGQIIYFLNADDRLYDSQVIEDIVNEFEVRPDASLIYGNAVLMNKSLKPVFNYLELYEGEVRTLGELVRKGICHQRIFVRRELFNKIGPFDIQYKILADVEWLAKVWRSGVEMVYIQRKVVVFNHQGLSQKASAFKVLQEKFRAFYRVFGLITCLYYLYFALLRWILSKTL